MANRPKYCRECGGKLRETSVYCPHCGIKIRIKRQKSALSTPVAAALAVAAVAALLFFIGPLIQNSSPAPQSTPVAIDEDTPEQLQPEPSPTIPDTLYTPDEDSVRESDEGLLYIDNTLLVFFTPESSDAERLAAIEAVGGSVAGSTPALDEWQVRVSSSDEDTLMGLCDQLELDPVVVIASMDTLFPIEENAYWESPLVTTTPKDPWSDARETWPAEWDVVNPDGNNWGFEAIDAPGAWEHMDEIEPVPLGIMDTGVTSGHPDLNGLISNFPTPIGSGENTPETQEWNDYGDHGTHVAGIMVAKGDNGIGLAGIAHDFPVYSVDIQNKVWWKVWRDDTGKPKGSDTVLKQTVTTSQHLEVFSDLVSHGTKVLNLSMGYSATRPRKGGWPTHEITSQGRNYSYMMHRLLKLGYDFVVVQAAGNDGVDAIQSLMFAAINADNCYSEPTGPTKSDILERVVIVGNCGIENGRYYQAKSSNGGSQVDVCAPGEDIWSCYKDGYETLSGTSMAAPFVTGICGLVWGANPELTGAEVRNIVCDPANCGPIVPDNPASPAATGDFPLVNARKAVEAALATRPGAEPAPAPAPEPSDTRQLFLEYIKDNIYLVGHTTNYSENTSAEGVLYTPGQYEGEYTEYLWYSIADFDSDGTDELFILSAEEPGPWISYSFYEGDSGSVVLSHRATYDAIAPGIGSEPSEPFLRFHKAGTVTVDYGDGSQWVFGVDEDRSAQLGLGGYAEVRGFSFSEGKVSTYTSGTLAASEPESMSYEEYQQQYGWAIDHADAIDSERVSFYEEFGSGSWHNW